MASKTASFPPDFIETGPQAPHPAKFSRRPARFTARLMKIKTPDKFIVIFQQVKSFFSWHEFRLLNNETI